MDQNVFEKEHMVIYVAAKQDGKEKLVELESLRSSVCVLVKIQSPRNMVCPVMSKYLSS